MKNRSQNNNWDVYHHGGNSTGTSWFKTYTPTIVDKRKSAWNDATPTSFGLDHEQVVTGIMLIVMQ